MARDNSTAAYLHEFIEPQVRRHNDEHASLLSRVDELRERLDALVRAHNGLWEKHRELQARYAAQEQRMADLDARFTNIAGMWTRENHPGKQTEDDNRHHDLAGAYERFLQSEVFPLVISPTEDGRILSAALQAAAYSEVSHVLFGSADPAPDGVRAALAHFAIDHPAASLAELCRRAADITAQAARLGRGQRWDFERGEGRLDPARQVRYAGSAGDGPDEVVTFVVSPGYIVDGAKVDGAKVVVRQQVFTTRAQPPGPDRRPAAAPGLDRLT